MAQDNNIPLGVFQGPSPADNFLSSYAAGQQAQRQREQDARQKVVQGREDVQYGQQQNAQAIDQLGATLDQVKDGDTQGFEQAKAFAIQNKLIDPNTAAQYTVNDLPRIRALSQQARQLSAQRATADLAQRKFATDERVANANINQSNASADASRAQAEKLRNPGAGGFDNTTFDNISSLRKEFTAATKTYGDVRDAYGRILQSAKNPSAAGDLSLIFNYMKVLDPGSTVREGEFATAQNATGVPSQIINYYNKIRTGERLNEEQRTDFVTRAGMLYNRQNQTQLATKAHYDDLAKRFGMDPNLVTSDQSGGIVGPDESKVRTPTTVPDWAK